MLSFPKILLTIAVIAAVFLVGKAISRRSKVMVRKGTGKSDRKGRRDESVDLSKCSLCDTFVGPDSLACERQDCPQRE